MDLAKRVAGLFSEKPPKHCWEYMQATGGGGNVITGSWHQCVKCTQDITVPVGKTPSEECLDPCPIPDPIDITDLGKALECFRGRYHSKRGVKDAIVKIHPYRKYNIGWVCVEATPEQIWEICCLAKEGEK